MVIGVAKVCDENGSCIYKIVNQEIIYNCNYCLKLSLFLLLIVRNFEIKLYHNCEKKIIVEFSIIPWLQASSGRVGRHSPSVAAVAWLFSPIMFCLCRHNINIVQSNISGFVYS